MKSENDNISDIELPFSDEKFEIGVWVYKHRAGLCITLIAYLIVAICFVAAKITLEIRPQYNALVVDLQDLAELEQTRDELQKRVKELQQQQPTDWSDVKNRVSNENSTSESQMNQSNPSETDQLLKDAAKFQQEMAQNRADYESGVAEAKAIKNRDKSQEETSKEERKDERVSGNVTVSYSFDKPVRHARYLYTPAYMCEGGGEVVVNVVVNNSGEVISAKIASGGDTCMQECAISSARASKFNIDSSAPTRHNGQIVYMFVPQ